MSAPAPVPDDDIVFFAVKDALAEGGCPVCRVAYKRTRRYLWGFLYERVNDPQTREELLASRGFCARHAWALGQFHDALGVAIVYCHLVQDLERNIARVGTEKTIWRGGRALAAQLRKALTPSQECPACQQVKEVETAALDALIRRIQRRDVWERLSGPSGLCLPHFTAGLALARDSATAHRLLGAELAALAVVVRDLGELIRKHDYRFSREGLTPEEGRSWTRAIEFLVGRDPLEERGGISSGY